MIPVTVPDIGQKELEEVSESFESGWIGLGPKVDKFENAFGEEFGYDHVIATNSGTNALDLALKASNPSGSHVIVPPITWISTAHVGTYNNYDIYWADVNEETLSMDPASLSDVITKETAAVIPVHYGGQPAEIEQIVDIAHNHDAIVIEDCAHAPGATYEGTPVGQTGDIGCFSFQATKPLTTGEGGALVTDNSEIANKVRRLSKLGVDKSTHERSSEDGYSWYYEVTDIGYKYFMHDISAGIGLAQLERLPETRARRQEIAETYRGAFADIDWIDPLTHKSNTRNAWYNYTVRVPAKDREAIIQHLEENDVGSTVHYMPLYKHPIFESADPDLPTTESVWEQILTLPMSSSYTPEDILTVIDAVCAYEPK